MRFQRLVFAACVAALSLVVSGCAVNRASANVGPGANLTAIKRVHVVHVAEDDRRIDELIASRMTELGFVATTGPDKRKDVDANMTYIDRWMWDLTLTRVSDRQVVLRKAITSTSTATMSAAFAGAERLRLAVEGAAKANIAQGLAAIGQLDL